MGKTKEIKLAPTVILGAGFGKPEEENKTKVWPIIWLNQSRMVTNAICHAKYYNRYRKNFVSKDAPHSALSIGSLWHGCVERIDKHTIADVLRWATVEAGNIDYSQFPSREKEVEKFLLWLEHALPIYQEWRQDHRIIVREQPFWMIMRLCDRYYGFVGTFDAIGVYNGRVANFEFKTIAEHENVADFLAIRSKHVQDALYFLALRYLWRRTKTLKDAGLRPQFTVYELARKAPYPLKASKNGTVEERREQWRHRLFYRQTISMNEENARSYVRKHVRMIPHPLGDFEPETNYYACRIGTNRVCEYFDHCWHDKPLEEPHFMKREPDYCDGLHTWKHGEKKK